MDLIEMAMRRGGLKDEQLMASCSDGADAARQESQGSCQRAHERAQAAGTRDPSEKQRSQGDTCCIHGKALEEVEGMKAAFGPNYFVDSLRLLHELVGASIEKGGRPDEYRKFWGEPVLTKEGVTLPALPLPNFDQNLGKVAEP